MSEAFREELRRRRLLLKLSAKELSLKVGGGPTLVRDLEEGRTKSPTLDTAQTIARALGCTISDMLGERRASSVSPDAAALPAMSGVPEIDVYAGAGGGGEAVQEAFTVGGAEISGDGIRGIWSLPDEYLNELRVTVRRARIIKVRGDSMEPTIQSEDRVMVDLGDSKPSPDGVFAIWDGLGVVIKRLEHIPSSSPPAFKIISDNPRHSVYERTLDEIRVIGRVIWFARRL